ncbi:MAG: hypothetical protein SFV18_19215 [Bryobacteraceae bacterium]|nr:hypothetical protein [Bryobacteraceae bacterium]
MQQMRTDKTGWAKQQDMAAPVFLTGVFDSTQAIVAQMQFQFGGISGIESDEIGELTGQARPSVRIISCWMEGHTP